MPSTTKENQPFLRNSDESQEFFFTLIPDWYNMKQKNYKLAVKLNHESVSKLLEIAEQKTYAIVCLRILYQYFYESDLSIDNYESINSLCDISHVLQLKNKSFKIDLLKLIVAHWNSEVFIKNDGKIKEKILSEFTDFNRNFIKMAYLLHENLVNMFEFKLEEHLSQLKEKFGDFHEYLIMPDLPLLLLIMKRRKMHKTVDFTFAKCPYMKYNSTILTMLETTQDHQRFIMKPFDDRGLLKNMSDFGWIKTTLENFETLPKKDAEVFKTLMFGWKIENGRYQENLLEKIMMQPEAADLIDLVWDTFRLSQKGYILNMKNPEGKRLIDYVDFFDQENFTNFFMRKNSQEPTFSKRKFFLMLLNQQFLELKGKTLFEYYIESELQGETVDFNTIFYLLEEKGIFSDVLNDESVPFMKLKTLAVNRETAYNINDDFVYSRLFKVDDLMCNIIAYSEWKSHDELYRNVKSELIKIGIVYEVLFMIVEDRDESEFERNVNRFKKEICDFYLKRYRSLEKNSNYTTNFMLVFLIAAMKHNKRKIIDTIFKSETFNNVDLIFPENIATGSIYNYVALKMLQNGHHLGKSQIPSCWMTPKVMNDFLDSQVVYHGHELIEINCDFMLHPYTKKLRLETEADVNNMMIFHEDTETLKFLMDNENVKSAITHPVVSTYINLKSFKFGRIYLWNFAFFLLLFVLPFTSLIINHFVSNKLEERSLKATEPNTNNDQHNLKSSSVYLSEIMWLLFCAVGIISMITREVYQMKFVEKSFTRYILKTTNRVELFIILMSLAVLGLFIFKSTDLSKNVFPFLSALLLLAMGIEVLVRIPISSRQKYTMITKNVVTYFPKFFLFFGLMLVPFSFCFCIIFRNNTEGEFFENFQGFWTSLFKLLLMLAGEYSIQIVKLNELEMIFVSFFVLTTFWLFALIVGFSVSDMKDLRDNARREILEENAKKILHLSRYFYEIYESYELGSSDADNLNRFQKYIVKFYKMLLTKHILIQKIDKIYVNIKTREMSVKFVDRHETIFSHLTCSTRFFHGDNNFMDETDFSLIREIINERKKKEMY